MNIDNISKEQTVTNDILRVSHISGAGNTFAVLLNFPALPARVVQALCNRTSLGLPKAEGVIVIHDPTEGRFGADFYNSDGSVGMMCGNGSRAAIRYALDNGATANEHGDIAFTMAHENYIGRILNDTLDVDTSDVMLIAVTFPPPRTEQRYPAGSLTNVDVDVYYCDVNSDHVVVFGSVDDATSQLTRTLRHHASFSKGVNVNYVEAVSTDLFKLATYERGVEDITGACGTGAISSAIALWRSGLAGPVVTLLPPSGRELHVRIEHHGDQITSIVLAGDAVYDAPVSLFNLKNNTYLPQ